MRGESDITDALWSVRIRYFVRLMSELTHIWRPRPVIRAVAIGVVWRDDRILVAAVTDDNGHIKGWRPLGGGIEFGETAEAALVREFAEELQAQIKPIRQIAVMQNLFAHQGDRGHEIVFVIESELTTPGLAEAESFILEDSGARVRAAWRPLDEFRSERAELFPDGLLSLL
ncbi:NUDIX domain-containing protein [Roseobacter sp. HKCCD9010]|uniref:NUDIX hydrolase n=2 Tax=unclassified Roseobacter TaxID=196798 RepID=UPI001491FC5E|nr:MULTISPECIES: NUDIX domain-containing protein [unclassified Roseobacter]MBF9050395.1 NUDIX domain-containing protein [Rhodobacterales bacterium HKCCD4356]NNV39209.1 NUDIX domain-containing protein [Roseobacter sp. HKCCD9054]NNV76948.1 NUDIX domain-containing protein [Roseobacter sp. HKCCD6135]NNW24595.1 NUDIX domain-containing protein [Roseobacter sp. HKCCD5929]NNW33180.1 NUDIX domain-containing protein [Roseobacter sp. HKCCD8198]NNW50025.1 NUDIX domain-containing protein [Roseobacter sp. 